MNELEREMTDLQSKLESQQMVIENQLKSVSLNKIIIENQFNRFIKAVKRLINNLPLV